MARSIDAAEKAGKLQRSVRKGRKQSQPSGHHGQTTLKQCCINVIYVEITLFKRRLTMNYPLGRIKSVYRIGYSQLLQRHRNKESCPQPGSNGVLPSHRAGGVQAPPSLYQKCKKPWEGKHDIKQKQTKKNNDSIY